MESFLGAQWQSQLDRRRRIIRVMLLIIFGVVVLLIGLWFWVTQPLFSRPVARPRVSVDPTRLELHVRMLAKELVPRDEGHTENLDRVATFIQAELEQAKSKVSEQAYEVNGKTYRNVKGHFGPETPERIVVGAHYDTAGPLPGADDNASGVAGLIELGYLLGATKLPLRVELVAFTLEEPPYFRSPLMGSAIHARSLKDQGVELRAMFSLEMIGYSSDAPISQNFPAPFLGAFYPSRGDFIALVGTLAEGMLTRRVKRAMRSASPLPVYSINAPKIVPGVDFSDQLSYWEAGYHALMLTDTAFYRNPHYHTALDTPERLDYRRMGMVIEGVYAAVIEVSR